MPHDSNRGNYTPTHNTDLGETLRATHSSVRHLGSCNRSFLSSSIACRSWLDTSHAIGQAVHILVYTFNKFEDLASHMWAMFKLLPPGDKPDF